MMRNLFLKKNTRTFLITILTFWFGIGNAIGATITITTNTNWSAIGPLPTSLDDVVITNGAELTVDITNANCRSIQIASGSSNGSTGTLSFNSGSQVTVSGTVTLGDKRAGSLIMTKGGTLVCQSLVLGGGYGTSFLPGTGTVILTSTNTLPSAVFTTFNNLNISGGTTTTGADLTINGNLNIGNGSTFNVAGYNLTVNGATTIGGGTSGTLNISAYNGTKIFTGLVTINSGGKWDNSSASSPVTFRGGITNNGIFTSGSPYSYTFDTNSQTLNGIINMTGAAVVVSGINLTNNGALTLSANFSGSGTLINASGGTVNLSSYTTITRITNQGIFNISESNTISTVAANFNNTGTINLNGSSYITGITNNAAGTVNFINVSQTIGTINNTTATSILNVSALIASESAINILAATAPGNTVNYSGLGDQTIKNTIYSNLVLSGSGTKTAAGSITVNNNTTLSNVTFKSGSTTGYSSSLGSLLMGSSSTIALGTGNHSLTFSNSSAASWAGTLTITGWTGMSGSSGTAGKIFFGNSSSGLSSSQLAQIKFQGYSGTAIILSTGELVPNGSCVNVSIISASAAASPICSDATTTLSANGVVGTNAVVKWWTGTGGTGTNLGTGATLTAGPGTYYARVTGDCGSPVEASITVESIPNTSISSVTGTSPLCIGSTAKYIANGVVLSGGTGTWSSDNPLVATVDGAGNVTALSAGTCNITYTITGGCGGTKAAQQQLLVGPSPGDPSVFGDNQWNIYAYNGTNSDLSANTYRGYYAEPNLSFDTRSRWLAANTPSAASGYQGCSVDKLMTFVAKRRGFPCGLYSISIGHDDEASLYVNGTLVSSLTGWTYTPVAVSGNYFLDENSTVELRIRNTGAGDSYGELVFNTTPSLTGTPVINSPICPGSGSISGTSESNAEIVVYSGVIQIGTTTANSSGQWSLSVGSLSTGAIITATARANNKCLSNVSSSVSVLPANTVSAASSAPTLCVNTTLTPITHTITGATGISNNGVSGANNLPAGVKASWASNQITISGTPTEIGTFNYSISLTGGCGNVNATGTITVNSSTAITSQSTDGQSQCINGTFTDISVTSSETGTLSYQWYSNTVAENTGGSLILGATSASYTPLATTAGTLYYYCIVTGTCGTATSAVSGAFVVNPSLPVSVSIISSSNLVCQGSNVTFTATPNNGGTYPFYQWKVNGENFGTNNSSFTYTPANSDVITCELTSNLSCVVSATATSNAISMTVVPSPTSLAGSNVSTCASSAVNITAGASATNYSTIIWTSNGTGTFTNANSLTLCEYTPSTADVAAGSVVLTLTAKGDGNCTDAISSKTLTFHPQSTIFNVTGGGFYCSGGSGVSVGLSGSENGVSYQLYKNGNATGSVVSGSGSAINFGDQTAGAYTVKATNSTTSCTQDMNGTVTVTVDDKIAPIITQCLSGETVSCVSEIPAGKTSYQGFNDAGGEVSENCTALSSLTVTFVDVISHDGECKVTRTYTIKDTSGNPATCTQIFTIDDTKAPIINSVADIQSAPNDNSCGANLYIAAPTSITENCSLVNEGANYQYTIAGIPHSGHGSFTALFPEGITAITWTVTDVCGHVSAPIIQTVKVGFNLTDIKYDNGSTETGSGSGVQPIQTSTHEYFVDDKKPEDGYDYSWGLYVDNNGAPGAEVDASLYSIVNAAHIKISFTGIPVGNYILSVIKTKNGTTCKNQKTRSVTILENTFDTELKPFGNQCQAGETGTPSTIIWEVAFSGGGVAPYSLNYAVNLTDESNNEIKACSGSVSNITLIGITPDLDHQSGCNTSSMPYMRVEKTATDSYKVLLKYTMSSVTARNFTASIQIDATDQFSVSEIKNDNNSETLGLHGVPNTSSITTD